MAFDPVTQRVLLNGGGGGSGINVETWTWNGLAWQQHAPASPPVMRSGVVGMAADLARGRVVLFGGSNYDFQTWEWDGAQWHASIPNTPGAWNGVALVYDTVRSEIVLQGGLNAFVSNQTWIYRTSTPATATAFGAGCAGSVGVPLLANVPFHLPWLGDTVRNRVNVAGGQLGALFVSSFDQLAGPFDLSTIGMPGCSLLVPADVVEFRAAQAGSAEWSLAIPNNPSFVGVPFRQQAFSFDLPSNPLGLVASNGLSLTPGIR
jgi:hypothetical protein